MTSTIAKILDGKWLAKVVTTAIASEVKELSPKVGRPPGLAVILVGENPGSITYVSNKERTAKECGFNTFNIRLTSKATSNDVKKVIKAFNKNKEVDGILLQLPLPSHLRPDPLLDLIDPEKDADGLHPLNQGLLQRGDDRIRPCTPLGVMKLIDLAFSKVSPATPANEAIIPRADLSQKIAVVIGRSILVGKPVATMLLERNATVVTAHSRSANLPGEVKRADVVVAAVGVSKLVKGDWIKPGAVVIDVGINRLETGKLAGDVDADSVSRVASALTPVPGGVGPMTVAMLMSNTLQAYKRKM